ncbi:MAG: cupin domain-containing protein [Balneolaceae bacterium]|nr:cupin domain-containing protein [Balneolaceae bacterium]
MIKCTTFYFDDDGSIPNNPKLPLLVYTGALEPGSSEPGPVTTRLTGNGWQGTWINGIYTYHHYHSTAHEVLVVTGGSATVQFGGASGKELQIQKGDAVVIPAGVGHCNLDSSMGFRVVGAYPEGQNWDLCTGEPGERPRVLENIRAVPLPRNDPITGKPDPLLVHWGTS